jgi:predicted lipoprotein with Yx(FWY)xxD motif
MQSGLQGGRFPTRRSSLRGAAAALALGTLPPLIIGGIAAAVSSHKVRHVVVSTTRTTRYGTILVSGKTVYTLKASNVACGSKCLKIWPELLLPKGVHSATAGSGVNAASLGTVMRRGGSLQVTYAGKPLYWFYGDTAPAQVHGNITDKWGMWSVVVMVPAAAAPLTGSTVPPTTTSSAPHSASTPNTTPPNTSSNSNAPATAPPAATPPTAPPPPTPPPTTTPPTTTPTTSPPAATTTTSPGGGGVGF